MPLVFVMALTLLKNWVIATLKTVNLAAKCICHTFVAYIVEVFMGLKPGQSSGRDGGVYRERGPRGGQTDNYTTIPDNHTAPPTSKPGATWVPVKRTPDSKR